jgi:hypothetical protein
MKYGAKKTVCDQLHTHDSKLEAARCDYLHKRQRMGEISHLAVHPQFFFVINGEQLKHDNGRRVGVKLDFQYFTRDKCVVEDVKPKSKSAISKDWPLRKAVFKALYPGVELYEISTSDSRSTFG